MTFKHQQTMDSFYQWRKQLEERESANEVRQAKRLDLSTLESGIDSTIDSTFDSLGDIKD